MMCCENCKNDEWVYLYSVSHCFDDGYEESVYKCTHCGKQRSVVKNNGVNKKMYKWKEIDDCDNEWIGLPVICNLYEIGKIVDVIYENNNDVELTIKLNYIMDVHKHYDVHYQEFVFVF